MQSRYTAGTNNLDVAPMAGTAEWHRPYWYHNWDQSFSEVTGEIRSHVSKVTGEIPNACSGGTPVKSIEAPRPRLESLRWPECFP